MSGKIKIIAAVVVCGILLFIGYNALFGQDQDNQNQENKSSAYEDESNNSSDSFESSQESSVAENDITFNGIVSFTKEFLNAYFSIDSTTTGVYDSVQHIKNYQKYMTESAKEKFETTEGEGDTADSMSILRTMDMCKVYVSEETESTSKILCLAYVTTTIDEQFTDELLLIGLDLIYQNGSWLVDDISINHNLYNLQAPIIELFE